jgi:hypothetical protein
MTATLSGPHGRTTLIQRNSADTLGLRVATDEAAALKVMAFLSTAMADVAATGVLDTSGAYILVGPRVCYLGETGLLSRRLLEHAHDPSKTFASEVFIVAGLERRLDKATVIHLQARFTEMIEARGLLTVQKGVGPCASDLPQWRKDNIDRMLVDVLPLLFDLGFRGLDAVCAPEGEASDGREKSPNDDDGDDADDGAIEIGVSVAPPGVEEFELRHMNTWARGYEYLGRFIVVGGSEIRTAPNASISSHTANRRQQLFVQEAVEPIPGVSDRQRLKVAVAFPSRAIAAKVCAGAHCGTDKWRPLGRTPVIVAN